MSRAAINPVSKLTRSIGSSTKSRPVLESSGLTPAYAELLRSHRRKQWDNTSKPFGTTPLQPPTTNPIVLPTHLPPSNQPRHTPVPLMGRPKNLPPSYVPGAVATEQQTTTPDVVYMAEDQDPNHPPPDLKDLEKFDVDEAQLKAQGSTPAGEPESKGMVRDIWDGMMDDVFGPPKVKRS